MIQNLRKGNYAKAAGLFGLFDNLDYPQQIQRTLCARLRKHNSPRHCREDRPNYPGAALVLYYRRLPIAISPCMNPAR